MRNLPEMKPETARDDHWGLVRQLIINAIFGVGLGLAIGIALIYLDVGGLGTRIGRAGNPWLATFILLGPLALTFGGAVAGSFVMAMPYERRFREPARADKPQEEDKP